MADENGWHVADKGQTIGPMTLDELVQRLPRYGGEAALVYGPGMGSWTPAGQVEAVRARMRAGNRAGGAGGPPPPPLNYAGRPRADEIDYQVFGSEMQYFEVTLDPGETVIAEAGGMMYMSAGITMQTVFGDP